MLNRERLIKIEESAWNRFVGFIINAFTHLKGLNRFELTKRMVTHWLDYSYNGLVGGRENYGPIDFDNDNRDMYKEGIEESPRDKNVYRCYEFEKYKDVMTYIEKETYAMIILTEMYHATLEGRLHRKWEERLKGKATLKRGE